jgi:general stress protein 26
MQSRMASEQKNWAWVLERPCPECRLDTRTIGATQIPAILRENAAAWQHALTTAADPAVRPDPGTWSAVEYACHVRDLLVLCGSRVDLMLTQDDPVFENWDQDDAVGRYGEQQPDRIAGELAAAAAAAAERLERVPADQWQRTGRRSDGVHYTVETFGRNLVHEAVHHLYDVTGAPHGSSARSLAERQRAAMKQLREHSHFWLATASDGHGPHLIPVSFWWDGSRLTTATFENSRTVKNIQAQPKVRVSVGTTADVLLIDAVASLVPVTGIDPAEADGYARASRNDPRSIPGFVYIRLTPRQMQMWRNPAEFTGRTVMRGGVWLDAPVD